MPRSNRVLILELRLLDVEDDQLEACKELVTETAKELHAAATLLCGGTTKPKVFFYGENFYVNISKTVEEEEQ